MKIKISMVDYQVTASLKDTETAKAVYNTLPFEGQVNTWGDEIYFQIPVVTCLESEAKSEVEVGDLAIWPTMPAFCIFFGPTPASVNELPRAASAVNVFGKLDTLDVDILRKQHSSIIRVEKIIG